jgi:hypothetical protein
MAKPSADQIVEALLGRHGRTYASDLGIDLERDTPSMWIVGSAPRPC